jgi:BirA family biotin operon repressor/biotin-[acetyl-CoA-carboxylase] ligase
MTDSRCWTLVCQERGTSTSDLAKAAALDGLPAGSAFLLGEQTAGRGRQGRRWSSQRGGMYVSVLLYPSRSVNSWFALSFATALALHDVVKTHLTEQILHHDADLLIPAIGLKWPNDVLVNNRKVAGILLEAQGDSLIIGSGVNIDTIAPIDQNPHQPIAFGDFPGILPEPKKLAESYLSRLQFYYELWEQDGFAPVRDLWLGHALHMKQTVSVNVAGQKITGKCIELLDDGGLVLRDESGTSHYITTGDVELIGG